MVVLPDSLLLSGPPQSWGPIKGIEVIKIIAIKIFYKNGELKEEYIEDSQNERIIDIVNELELYDSVIIQNVKGDELKDAA